MKDLSARECWVGKQPRRDLLPFALEWILARAPIMRPSSLLILFLALFFEQGWRRMRNAINRNLLVCDGLHRKLKRSSRWSPPIRRSNRVPPERPLSMIDLGQQS